MRALGLVAMAVGVLAGGAFAASAQAPHEHEHGGLGTVSFSNSGAAAAQAPFLRGVALLHSFEYDDAEDAFHAAERADSSFALPYWFEAMTHTQLLWGVDDADSARAVLARLGPTPAARLARAANDRERAYGAAVEAFYADTNVATRSRAFADSLRHIAARDPKDLEAAAFASLAIQMAMAGSRAADTLQRNEAIALAERVYHANSQHPGATHYLIHAYDDPTIAPRGLAFARAYARVAPAAEHALHMPSHIFVQVGMWDDLVRSNEQSWAASRADVKRRGDPGTANSFHSLEWLQYGYLEQGRYAAGRALIDTARAVLAGADLSHEIDARFVVADLTFGYAAASGRWEETAAMTPPELPPPNASRREQVFVRIARFQAGYAAAMRGDTATAMSAARSMRANLDALPATAPLRALLTLTTAEIEATCAVKRGDTERAIVLLREAARIDGASTPSGPTWYPPPSELLGAVLARSAAHEREAASVYESGLAARPNRSEAWLGLAGARAASGDRAGAAKATAALRKNWHAADKAALARVP
ncbi:MAG: hypothetical protein ABI637_11590 [Gemmatimonadota bacterium]